MVIENSKYAKKHNTYASIYFINNSLTDIADRIATDFKFDERMRKIANAKLKGRWQVMTKYIRCCVCKKVINAEKLYVKNSKGKYAHYDCLCADERRDCKSKGEVSFGIR